MTDGQAGSADRRRMRAVVYGRVQGVYFRQSTVDRARSLGLDGWVANRWDRTVEVVAEGEEAALQALLRWLHEGPPAARVTRVQVIWQAPIDDDLNGFEVRY